MRNEAEFMEFVKEKIALRQRRRVARLRQAAICSAGAAAFACITVGTVLSRPGDPLPPVSTQPGQQMEIETGLPEYTQGVETSVVEPWSLSVLPEITFGGVWYSITHTTEPLPLGEADVGDALGENLYTLAGVAREYFLLCRDTDGGFWGYVNYDYRPASLGEMVAVLSLRENLSFGALYTSDFADGVYQAWAVNGLDAERLWALLLVNADAAPEALTVRIDPDAAARAAAGRGEMVSPPYDPSGQYIVQRSVVPDVSLSISLPRLGFSNISIMVSREGWLWTNLLSSDAYFAVPAGLCDDLLAYARAAGDWVDITTKPCETSPAMPE